MGGWARPPARITTLAPPTSGAFFRNALRVGDRADSRLSLGCDPDDVRRRRLDDALKPLAAVANGHLANVVWYPKAERCERIVRLRSWITHG